MKRSGVLLGLLFAGCIAAPPPQDFPPARAARVPRPPSSREIAMQRCSQEIAALEQHALLVFRFGCARCTRFQSDMILVLHDGRFAQFDLVSQIERVHGQMQRADVATLEALLASEAWAALAEGPPPDVSMPAWTDLAGGGRRVRRNPRGDTPLPQEMRQLVETVRAAIAAPNEATDTSTPLTSCPR